jgi:uncharacterized membrane protein
MSPGALALARALHVLGVVIWIGGVGFVSAVLLPALRSVDDPVQRAELFERLEGRFSWIARGAVLLVGASGFYMLQSFDLWDRFCSAAYWWMHAMVGVWAVFAVMLFVAEPLFLHRWFARRLRERPDAFALIARMHWLLLTISLLTIVGAVAGAHGIDRWF